VKDGPFDRLPIRLDADEAELADDDPARAVDYAVSPRQLAIGGAIVAALIVMFVRSRRRSRRPDAPDTD